MFLIVPGTSSEEALSEQKEVCWVFGFCFVVFFRKHLKQLAETQPYKCAVLWGGSQQNCNIIEYPEAPLLSEIPRGWG